MTDEERDIITRFIERVSGAVRPAPSAGSVPATLTALPPVDPRADQLIGDLFQRYPEARYRLTQTAFVQEHALTEAQNRIQALQTQLQQARGSQPTQPAQPSGGFFHNLFGGGPSQGQNQPPPPQYQPYQQQPPQQQYAQPYAPQPQFGASGGMFQRSGSGFLGSALTTAAGVAGGMIAGNALMNLFEGPRGFGGGGFGAPGGFGGAPPGYAGGGPWDTAAAPDAQVSGSAWDNQTETGQPAGWDQGADAGQSWDPAPGADTGGGWDSGGADMGGDSGGGGGWDDGGNSGSV